MIVGNLDFGQVTAANAVVSAAEGVNVGAHATAHGVGSAVIPATLDGASALCTAKAHADLEQMSAMIALAHRNMASRVMGTTAHNVGQQVVEASNAAMLIPV